MYVGVKALIQRKDGKILLLKVDKEKDLSFLGDWDLPGGRLLKNDQSVYERLVEKIKEETGIKNCKPIRVVAAGLVNRLNLFLVIYLCEVVRGGEEVTTDRGHGEYEWVVPKGAADLLWQLSDELRNQLRELKI